MVAALIHILYSGVEDDRLGVKKGPDKRLRKYMKCMYAPLYGRATSQFVRLDFISPPEFGRVSSIILPRKGHFIRRIFLVANLPDLDSDRAALGADAPQFAYTNSVGHALIQEAAVTIAGVNVDTLNSRLLEVINEARVPLDMVPTTDALIGREPGAVDGVRPGQVCVPLPFWFCESADQALPIDAISTDEVRLHIAFRAMAGLYTTRSRSSGGLASFNEPTYYVRDPSGIVQPDLYLDPSGPVTAVGRGRPIVDWKLGDTYLLAEYVYVDSPEANRYRIADLEVKIRQHVIISPVATEGRREINVPLRIGNPVTALRFFVQRNEAAALNSYFLATRDLGSPLWWPDPSGLTATRTRDSVLIPGFAGIESEPVESIVLRYQGQLTRYSTENPYIFRALMPAIYDAKAPWYYKYYYMIPFGESGANFDKIERADLDIRLSVIPGTIEVPVNMTVYIFAETVNILRIFGGRAGLLF
jgi:hypothetical protein